MTELVWWKALTVLTFIISISLLFIKIYESLPPTPEYEVIIIELDNTNFGENIHVIDYLCDEGVYVNNIQTIDQHWFYASTREEEGISINEGKCAIKVIKE